MKQLFCCLVLSNSFICMKGQTESQIETWFLDIPVHQESKIVHNHLSSDPRITILVDETVIGGDKFPGVEFLFAGKLNQPQKLEYSVPDSINVEQTYGLMRSEVGKFTGKTKNINIEYYFGDTTVLKRTYEAAIQDLTRGIKKKDVYPSRYTLNGDTFNGKMFYFQNRKKFKRGEILLKNLSEKADR